MHYMRWRPCHIATRRSADSCQIALACPLDKCYLPTPSVPISYCTGVRGRYTCNCNCKYLLLHSSKFQTVSGLLVSSLEDTPTLHFSGLICWFCWRSGALVAACVGLPTLPELTLCDLTQITQIRPKSYQMDTRA